jgi:hypothetical protein
MTEFAKTRAKLEETEQLINRKLEIIINSGWSKVTKKLTVFL